MQHGQKVHTQPIELLKKTGNNILNIPDGHICCGSAGTYNIMQTDIAKRLLEQKVQKLSKKAENGFLAITLSPDCEMSSFFVTSDNFCIHKQ